MEIILNDIEIRILGCLIEKELTTPEYYPLTLNSLVNACNQKSNRNPIVSYDESIVTQGIEGLERKNLVRKTFLSGSRVTKYIHTLLDRFDLSREELAIFCELMVRGPQTIGEIRLHTERMFIFKKLEEVENTLIKLIQHDPPLIIKLPREIGRKECRYTHTFSGDIKINSNIHQEISSPQNQGINKIAQLEKEIEELKKEIIDLKQAFFEFKSQF